MKYFVVWPDGRRFGPADADTLTQWAAEGRIDENTELESASTGARLSAGSVPGVVFGSARLMPPGLGPHSHGAGHGHRTEETAWLSSSDPYAARQSAAPYVTYSWLSLVAGLLCLGCIGTGAGVYFAIKAKRLGDPHAQAPYVVNLAMTALMCLASLAWVALMVFAVASG